MVENDIKIYKLSYSGEFEEQSSDNPLDLFTLYSILAIYSQKAKKMYIWVSKNATHSLKLFIPQIRELFAQKYPNLRILRNITVESGEEPFDFFKLFEFEKDVLAEHILAQEKVIEPINNEINELKEKMESFITEEQYPEAIQASEKLVSLSKQIKDKSLQKDQEELIISLKERQKIRKILTEIEVRTIETIKQFESFLTQDKIVEAHELVNNFKFEMQNNEIDLTAIPIIEKLFLKDENAWKATKSEEKDNLNELTILETDYKKFLKNEEFKKGEEIIQKAFELIDSLPDDTLTKKWNSFKKSFEKQKTEHEEKQKKLEEQVKEFEKKANETKNKFEALLSQKKNVEAHELVINFKLEVENNDIDIATLPIIDKLFLKEENEWNAAKLREVASIKKLASLEKDYKNLLKEEAFIKCEEIVQEAFKLLDSLLDDTIPKKWNSIKKSFEKLKTEHEEKQRRLKELIKETETKANETENKYEALLTQKKIVEAHELVNNFKLEMQNTNVDLTTIPIIEKLFLKEEKEWNAAKLKEEASIKKLENLEKNYKKALKEEDYPQCEEIVQNTVGLLDSILDDAIIKKWTKFKDDYIKKKLEFEEKQKKLNEQISTLQEKIEISLDKNYLTEVIDNCKELLELADKNEKPEISTKYSSILEDSMKELEETREIIDTLKEEILTLKEKGEYKKGVGKIDSMLEELEGPDFINQSEELEKLREELLGERENRIKIEEELKVLENKLTTSQESHLFKEAEITCEKIINKYQEMGNEKLVKQYSKTIEEIKNQHIETIEIVDSLIKEIIKLQEDGKIKEGIAKIDSIFEEIPPEEFPEENSKLKNIKKILIAKNEAILNFNNELNILENELSKSQKENNLHEALTICEKIIQKSKDIGKKDIEKKYNKIEQDLKKSIENKKTKIDSLLVEISSLKEKKEFEEIVIKIDSIVDEIPESIFSKQKKEFFNIKKEIINEIEKAKKILEGIKELEENLSIRQKENDLHEALTICGNIIQKSKDIGKNDIEKKYDKIEQDLKKKIEKKRNKIDSLLEEISNLRKEKKLEDIITKIDSMVDEIPETIFSKQKEEFVKIKKEVIRELEKDNKYLKQINELKEKIQVERKNNNFDYAKKLCDEIVKIAIENDKIAIATKYTSILKEINEEIQLKKIHSLKDDIKDLSSKGIESLNKSLFQESLTFFDKIINHLEKINK